MSYGSLYGATSVGVSGIQKRSYKITDLTLFYLLKLGAIYSVWLFGIA